MLLAQEGLKYFLYYFQIDLITTLDFNFPR